MANPTIVNQENAPLVYENRGYPPVTKTILTGQGTLAAGSVLGIITTGGKLKLVDDASVDGSQVAKFVLLASVDTSGGDVTVQRELLAAGIVNSDKLVFGGGDTIGDHDVALKDTGIIALNPDGFGGYDNT